MHEFVDDCPQLDAPGIETQRLSPTHSAHERVAPVVGMDVDVVAVASRVARHEADTRLQMVLVHRFGDDGP